MGTYNCQECMTKEINFLNELLLDGDMLKKNTTNNNNLASPAKVSIKTSKDNLIKALNKSNLSPEEKKYYENYINEHPNSVINLGQNNEIIYGNDSYEQNNEIKKIEEDESLVDQGQGGHNYFDQMDQQQMLEQERLMEEYKQQQLLILKEKENELKAEEEELKKQIEKAQNEERMMEESSNFHESLEPQKNGVNKEEEQQSLNQNSNFNKKEIHKIEDNTKKAQNKRKNNKHNKNKKKNSIKENNNSRNNNNNIAQNNKTEIIKQERVIRKVYNIEEQKGHRSPIVLRTKEQYMKQIEQMNNEESENKEEEEYEEEEESNADVNKEMNNEFKINENEHYIFSQKFKTETYEPEEEKNDYLDEQEDYNEKNNNDSDGPRDNRKKGNSKMPNLQTRNNNNMNYTMKNSPKDNRGKNMELFDEIGPRDSKRKDIINNKVNPNVYYSQMNLKIKSAIKSSGYQDKPYNNYKSNEQFNNTTNPKSYREHNDYIKREVLSSSSSQRSFKNTKQTLSPLFNQIHNEQIYQ